VGNTLKTNFETSLFSTNKFLYFRLDNSGHTRAHPWVKCMQVGYYSLRCFKSPTRTVICDRLTSEKRDATVCKLDIVKQES